MPEWFAGVPSNTTAVFLGCASLARRPGFIMPKKSHDLPAASSSTQSATTAENVADTWITLVDLSKLLRFSLGKCRYLSDPKSPRFDPTFPPRIQSEGRRDVRFSSQAVNKWMANQPASVTKVQPNVANGHSTIIRSLDNMSVINSAPKHPKQSGKCPVSATDDVRQIADHLSQVVGKLLRVQAQSARSSARGQMQKSGAMLAKRYARKRIRMQHRLT
jgi:hypothetical protein